MLDVKRVEFVDVAVSVDVETVEDVGLKRIARFHDERVEIKPPEPRYYISKSCFQKFCAIILTTQLWDTSALHCE